MKSSHSFILKSLAAAMAVIVSGCADEIKAYDDKTETNEILVNRILDSSVYNAVVTEHALYPYHFQANDSTLNDLGEERLEMLAEAYRTAPGPLVVTQGDCSTTLYDARVKCALRWLESAGVDVGKVTVSSNLPGGPGTPSSEAVQALEKSRNSTSSSSSSSPAGFSSGSSAPKGDK